MQGFIASTATKEADRESQPELRAKQKSESCQPL